MIRVLVTGATGFVGSAIARQLVAAGHLVTGISRSAEKLEAMNLGVTVIQADLISSDFKFLNDIKYDVVVHCAGSLDNEHHMHSLHVEATRRLLFAVKLHCRHWVQISSVGVYGPVKTGIVCENNNFSPIGAYETTKAKSEQLVVEHCVDFGIDFTILRPSNVFGINMPNDSLRALMKAVKQRRFFYIGRPSHYVFNYVSVTAVADTVVLCVQDNRSYNRDFIISTSIKQRDFVRLVRDQARLNGDAFILPIWFARSVASFGRYLPGFPLTSDRIEALTVSAEYDGSRVEQELGLDYGDIRSHLQGFLMSV